MPSAAKSQRSKAYLTSDERWKTVFSRLMFGYEVDIAAQGRIWPKEFGNAMPDYLLEHPRKARARIRYDAREQALADESRPWIARYIPDPQRRVLLQSFIACTFHGWKRESIASRLGEETHEIARDVEFGCRQIVEGLDLEGKRVLL